MKRLPRFRLFRRSALPKWLNDETRRRLEAAASHDPSVDADLVLEATDGSRCVLRVHRGRVRVAPGDARTPDARIRADAATLRAVLDGDESGVAAFLAGRLTMRGSLGLALRLDSLVEHPDKARRVLRTATVDAKGLSTFYLEAGEGPPVVLLHGLGATSASFLPTLWDLARDHRVIAPDLPGFGESEKPLRPYHAAFYARWLRDFLDAMGIERALVVGNSMGGRVAIELGLRFPERARRLVLLAPSPAWKRFRHAVPLVRFVPPELAWGPVPITRGRVTRTLRMMFSKPERLPQAWYDAAVDEFLRVFAEPRGRVAFFSAARQIYLERPHGPSGFWSRLEKLKVPSLFVWGSKDALVPARFARHVSEAVPHAESVVFEDCGHVPQFEHPERTSALIRRFFAGER